MMERDYNATLDAARSMIAEAGRHLHGPHSFAWTKKAGETGHVIGDLEVGVWHLYEVVAGWLLPRLDKLEGHRLVSRTALVEDSCAGLNARLEKLESTFEERVQRQINWDRRFFLTVKDVQEIKKKASAPTPSDPEQPDSIPIGGYSLNQLQVKFAKLDLTFEDRVQRQINKWRSEKLARELSLHKRLRGKED